MTRPKTAVDCGGTYHYGLCAWCRVYFASIGVGVAHAHEHTTHALRDVIEALPRYADYGDGMETYETGTWLRLSDVRAVVHKAATLAAPVAHPEDS